MRGRRIRVRRDRLVQRLARLCVAFAFHQDDAHHEVRRRMRHGASERAARVIFRRRELVEARFGFRKRGQGVDVFRLEIERVHERTLRIGVLLAIVLGEAERHQRQRPFGLEPIRLLQRFDRRGHVAALHQRDAEQVVILRDGRAHARQGIERRDRGREHPRRERHLRERAEDFFGIGREDARAPQRFERARAVAALHLTARRLQQFADRRRCGICSLGGHARADRMRDGDREQQRRRKPSPHHGVLPRCLSLRSR